MSLILIAIIAGSVFLDQLTKWLAVVYLQGEPSFPLWRDVLHFTFVKNEGAAFGMLANHRWVFMSISTLAVILMTAVLFFYAKEHKMFCISLAAVISGGIGNMIDRVANGYVVDFLRFEFYKDFPVFNVADIFVTLGCICLAVYMIFIDKTIFREQKAAVEVKENDKNG